LLGNWQINGILQSQTGLPFTPALATATVNTEPAAVPIASGAERCRRISGPSLTGSIRRPFLRRRRSSMACRPRHLFGPAGPTWTHRCSGLPSHGAAHRTVPRRDVNIIEPPAVRAAERPPSATARWEPIRRSSAIRADAGGAAARFLTASAAGILGSRARWYVTRCDDW